MAEIKAADVAKLRKTTGAGMMDCKKALKEAEGNFEAAIDILRTKGQKIASKRADRDATEGAVIAKVSTDGKKGIMLVLNCETDFVAKNEQFVKFAHDIVDTALANNASNLEELKALELNGKTITEEITNQTGVIGEKIDISNFQIIEAAQVTAYIHAGNRLATLVGFNKDTIEVQIGRDVAMQVAAMDPIAVDKNSIPQDVIDREIEVGKEQARNEGKPDAMLEKIAMGRLNKFFKESTLLNQQSVKDNKKTITEVLKTVDAELTVTEFKRYTLNV